MPTDQTEQVTDHKAEALRLLEESYGAPASSLEQAGRDSIAVALVHSNLAIAEGQERVAEEIAKLRRESAAQFTWWKPMRSLAERGRKKEAGRA